MKTIKYIILGVILSSLVFSSFSFYPSKKSLIQEKTVCFCLTYTQAELISKLDPKDTFFSLVNTDVADPESSKIGTCHESDMTRLWTYIQDEEFRGKVQEDLFIAAGAQINDQLIPLYAIRNSPSKDKFPSGSDLDEISVSLSEDEENYMLLFSFSESGSKKWASMTRMNIGKDIAILSQDKVISAPRLTEEIKNGKCAISGKFTESEANALKKVLEN